ncbi:hypothetical protein JCM8097_006692 [Rhodosporidiobolus ruineniae]
MARDSPDVDRDSLIKHGDNATLRPNEDAQAVEAENARLKERIRLGLTTSELDLASSTAEEDDFLLSRSENLVLESARVDLVQTVLELEKALEWEERRRADEEAKLERDRTLSSDAETLYEILFRRVEQARADRSRPDGEILVLRAQGRLDRLTSQFRRMQGALVQFIDDCVVGNEEDDVEGETVGAAKRTKPSALVQAFDLRRWVRAEGLGAPAEARAFELKKLIEVLMNRLITSPVSPYVSLSSLTPSPPPPELVSFLLRARIAKEHQKDADKVRLEDFASVVA